MRVALRAYIRFAGATELDWVPHLSPGEDGHTHRPAGVSGKLHWVSLGPCSNPECRKLNFGFMEPGFRSRSSKGAELASPTTD
jgi:hypothetical protein